MPEEKEKLNNLSISVLKKFIPNEVLEPFLRRYEKETQGHSIYRDENLEKPISSKDLAALNKYLFDTTLTVREIGEQYYPDASEAATYGRIQKTASRYLYQRGEVLE